MSTVDTPNHGLLRRLTRSLDWRANPVLVRDLRLYMRGRTLLLGYALTLAILVLTGVAYTVAMQWEYGGGRGLLSMPTYLLAVICGALIPNLVGERFRGELSGRAIELTLASGLPPARLVRGKLFGAWLLSLMAVSLAMPIYTTAYLLGGVSPWTMAGLAGGILIAGIVMPIPQLYLATSGKRTGLFRLVDSIASIGALVAMLLYAPLLLEALESSDDEYRVFFGVSVAAAILVFGFLYSVTVSRLRAEAEDREVRPRRCLAVAAVLGFLAALATMHVCKIWDMSFKYIDLDEMMVIAALCVAYPFAWGIYVISHGNAAQPRLLPSSGSRMRRWLGATGSDSLTAFFIVISIVLITAGYSGSFLMGWYNDGLEYAPQLLAPLIAIAYGLVVYQVAVRRFQRGIPAFGLLANVIIIVNLILAVPGYFFLVILTRMLPYHYDSIYYLLPIGLLMSQTKDRYDPDAAVWVGMAVFVVLILFLLPSVWRAWRKAGRPKRGSDGI
ncbi:MAG: hypothetical protein LUC93_04130 [Planctomycetaceae bacterium]|nr:hypothetical protein [Planctomycetaceae bacterium]